MSLLKRGNHSFRGRGKFIILLSPPLGGGVPLPSGRGEVVF